MSTDPDPPAARPGSLKAALANLGWLLGGRGVAAVLSLVYLAIVARTLGPAGFGQFALVTGIAQSVLAIVSFQTWQIIVRYGMAHITARAEDRLVRLIKACALLDGVGAVAGIAVAALAVVVLGPAFDFPSDMRWTAWGFCAVTLIAVRSTAIGILRLHDRFGAAATADAALPIARMIGAAVVWATGPSVTGFLAAWAIAEILSSIVFWLSVWRCAAYLPWRATRLGWRQMRAENDGIVRFSLITNASQTFTVSAVQAPVLIVGLYASHAAAGGYRLAHQLGRSLARGAQLFSRALFPELMRVRANSAQAGDFGKVVRRVTLGSAIAGAAILLVLLTVGKPLLGLIAGEAFLPAYPLLVLLGCAAVLELIGVGFEPALIASGRAGKSLKIQATTAILMMALLFVLVREQGAFGAGVAVLCGSALNFARMAWAAWRATRVRPEVQPATAATLLRGSEEDADEDK